MARYKQRSQDNIMVPVNLAEQLLPGTFEFTLNEIVDHQLDLSGFDQFYHNDDAGPKAYSPQAMLKIVLYAYSKGLLSSRKIEAACKSNINFMALSGEARPDHAPGDLRTVRPHRGGTVRSGRLQAAIERR
jgi:transposase